MRKPGYVYIMASARNGTICIGVASDLAARTWQHRTGTIDGFTRQYGCTLLVRYEAHDDLEDARLRERQIKKKWNRQWKPAAIERMNPEWQDLYPNIFG